MRLLLLSNSTNPGEEYLEYARQAIKDFLGSSVKNVLFIPYAGITISYDEYTDKAGSVFREIGYILDGIHHYRDPIEAVLEAEAIAIGGGNSFELLDRMYYYNLHEPVKMKVYSGIPFMGWSAGSNMACPTIMTTNDMPVTEPPSLVALDLIPFQINPHFTEKTIPGHGGESRTMRIQEFLMKNREIVVVGLPEGMIIHHYGNDYKLIGDKGAKIFKFGKEPFWVFNDMEFTKAVTGS